ncbi:type I restriction endonuclease subunit R, partial [Candidatus Micrarchaeota archaeon]|nr:type I restriction endonuclease subunit R [Candidatus Micrarchaeota archaeon]
NTLVRIYKILKEAYEPGTPVDREFTRKTAKLVREHTKSGEIKSSLEIYEIDEKTLKKLEESEVSDTEKVFNLIRSINNEIINQSRSDPYLISIGEKVELLSLLYKQRQKDTKETLAELKKKIEEINSAKKERVEKNMSPEIFSIYWILKNENIPDAENKSKQMNGVLGKYPYWRTSEEHERKVKQELYKIFTKSKIEIKKSVEIANKIIKILKGDVS